MTEVKREEVISWAINYLQTVSPEKEKLIVSLEKYQLIALLKESAKIINRLIEEND